MCFATTCYVALASNLQMTLLRLGNVNPGITADVAFYVPATEDSACKVTELHDARAFWRIAFLDFSTTVDYHCLYGNRACFLMFFLHYH